MKLIHKCFATLFVNMIDISSELLCGRMTCFQLESCIRLHGLFKRHKKERGYPRIESHVVDIQTVDRTSRGGRVPSKVQNTEIGRGRHSLFSCRAIAIPAFQNALCAFALFYANIKDVLVVAGFARPPHSKI